MASSVFFKFKSQKDPTRVEFDGTGISVFELKRDIITKSGLGDGTDFDLAIYTDDGKEEYDDDTTIIPRSTTVVARRLPPMKPGAGRAARYVSGKMPVNAKNSSRKEHTAKASTKATSNAIAQMNNAMTEEEKMAAMFQAQTEQWSAQQEEMAHQQPVFKPGSKKPANVPDHEPPQGYICYRCGEKGHWIQLCPTNDNPDYDNRPRVKRTTGIPKSFLKTVDKATALAQHGGGGEGDEAKTPSGIMVNADGEFVIAEPDKASWEQFQAKAKTTAAAAQVASQEDQEVRDRGLECPIDRRMFIDPMKTPCCEKTYCNDCITNALIESDFVCPGCQAEGVLIDDLQPDDDAVAKSKEYLADKDAAKKDKDTTTTTSPRSPGHRTNKPPPINKDDRAKSSEAESRTSPPASAAPPTSSSASIQSPASASTPTASTAAATNGSSESKKRPAEDPAENPKIPKAPKAMQKAQEAQQQQQQQAMMQRMMNGMPPMDGMGGMGGMPMMPPFGGMNPMMNGLGGMGMNGMNGMNMGMMNPMMNPMMGGGGMPGVSMNGNMANGGFPAPMGGNMWGGGGNMSMNGGGSGGMAPNGGMGPGGGPGMGPAGGMNVPNGNGGGGGGGGFQPGQFHPRHFSNPSADDDDAYFRKPVNPHRHQNRRRVRPSDYREL